MTRINTNVSSLVAQNTLGRSNASLSEALTRLSTGLRINTGKDDPAGLIASENLRSDITAIRRAISNTDRANQVIATADSALGQVSALLNDIRGLVTESANAGALSNEQLAANQLQVDSSLEALNRIAQTTTFQGRRLLDGSLDFLTTAGTNFGNLNDLQIDQANLGSTGSISVNVEVTTAATKAEVNIANVPSATTGVNASGSITFTDSATASTGTIGIATTQKQASGTATVGGQTFNLTALSGGAAAGAEGNDVINAGIAITYGASSASATYNATTNVLSVSLTQASGAATIGNLRAAIDAGADFNTTVGAATDSTTITAATSTAVALTGGTDAITQNITVTGTAAAASNISISVVEATGVGSTPTVVGDATNGYTVRVDDSGSTTLSAIASAIQGISEVSTAVATAPSAVYTGSADSSLNTALQTTLSGGFDAGSDIITLTSDTVGVVARTIVVDTSSNLGDNVINVTDVGGTLTVNLDDNSTYSLSSIVDAINATPNLGFTATLQQNVNGSFVAGTDTTPSVGGGTVSNIAGGVAASGGLTAAVILELTGSDGAEVLSFGAGTSINDLVSGINLVSDATGVEARIDPANATTLQLRSATYGTDAVVDLQVNSEGTGSTPAGTFTTSIGQGTRVTGADAVADINGVKASTSGNKISVNTATLDIATTVTADFTGTASFTISGGGALFQLGPDVVSNQQARLGIGSVNTSQLGGTAGKLFQLGTGGSAQLSVDSNTAAKIVEEAINQVTSLRGRLGAFQRTTLETNKNALNDTLVNLTDAESKVRDADFAKESAALTRAQILVQSGTTVLRTTNQNPQNVLALLR